MGRKLIQHGLSSLTVSLPRKWVKENNLKKGDEIEIEESKGKLMIATQKHPQHKQIDIDISNADPMIRRLIGATFKTGYDEVNIKFSSHDELKAVRDLIKEQFTGFEIINQNKDNILVKNISQDNFEEFNNVLRRFFLVLMNISSETSKAIEKEDFKWLKNNTLIKYEADKFADYCRRAINSGYETEFKRTAPLYTIIEQLEKVVDRYKDLCEYASKNKIKLNKNIKSVIKELAEFQESFYNLFYKFEIQKLIELGKKKQELQRNLDGLMTNSTRKEVKIMSLIDRILNLTFDLNGPLMAVYI